MGLSFNGLKRKYNDMIIWTNPFDSGLQLFEILAGISINCVHMVYFNCNFFLRMQNEN